MKNFPEWAKIGLKALIFLPVFLLLHNVYKWLPWPGLAWFSSTGETVYQHMKIAFFAYLVVCGLEYAVVRAAGPARGRFFYSRLLAAVLVPWGIFFGWYIAPALYGAPMPVRLLETLYANSTTLAVLVMIGITERSLEPFAFPRRLKVVLWIIAALLTLEFIIFSYRAPWADVFTIPPGW
jgi:hypothetical protein